MDLQYQYCHVGIRGLMKDGIWAGKCYSNKETFFIGSDHCYSGLHMLHLLRKGACLTCGLFCFLGFFCILLCFKPVRNSQINFFINYSLDFQSSIHVTTCNYLYLGCIWPLKNCMYHSHYSNTELIHFFCLKYLIMCVGLSSF